MAKKLPVGSSAARHGTSLNLGRGARGIDGDKGSDFSKKHTTSPWRKNPPREDMGRATSARNPNDDNYSRGAVGIDGTEGENILVQRMPDEDVAGEGEYSAGTRDIFDQVTENQHEVGGPYVSRTGPVREVKRRG